MKNIEKIQHFFCNRFFSGTGSGVPDRGAAGER
jgi:hypothetical protein